VEIGVICLFVFMPLCGRQVMDISFCNSNLFRISDFFSSDFLFRPYLVLAMPATVGITSGGAVYGIVASFI